MEKLTIVEKAYISGLFDGEGHFTVSKRKENPSLYKWDLGITNNNKEVLDWIKLKTGFGRVVEMTGKSRKLHWNKTYRWRLNDKKEIIEFYKLLLPYLKIKK